MSMADDPIVAAAKALIEEIGEEPAFQLTSLEMEAAACRGDMVDMKARADLLFAIVALTTGKGDTVIH